MTRQVHLEYCDPFICYVLVRHLPYTMNPGKAMAQVHHAATDMMKKFGKKKQFEVWLEEAESFGTVLTLQNQNKDINQVHEINNIINLAKASDMIAGIITDPTYPFDHQQTAEVITCAYVLTTAEMWEQRFKSFMHEDWKLCP